MLSQVADGVLGQQSEFLLSITIVVPGHAGALLIDPGRQVGPSAKAGWEWVSDIHHSQAPRLAARDQAGTSGVARDHRLISPSVAN